MTKTYYLKVYADNEGEAREVLKNNNVQLTELKDDEVIKVMTDDLQSTVEQAQEELKDRVKDYLLDSLQCQDDDEVYQEIADDFHEITDSNTPIYYSEIYDTYYLNRNELLEAYENAGGNLQDEQNPEQACIYWYINQSLYEYWNDELKDAIFQFCEYRDEKYPDDISDENEKELKAYIEKSFA